MSERGDAEFGRLIGADIEPESLDWQHLSPTADRDRLAWATGALDFDLVPPGGVGRWKPIGPAPLTVRNEQMFCGPGPTAGQVRDLAIDPTPGAAATIYMASNSAGLWKSTDGGASWKPVNDQLPSLRIGAVALDPDEPSIVYAGSGNLFDGSLGERRGAGLFKSIDRGATWMRIDGGLEGSTLARGGINRIVVTGPEQVAVGTQQALTLSSDGGATFDDNNPAHSGFIAALALDTSQRSVRRVRDASIASPVVLTCTRHGWRDNDVVYVGGVASNREANGRWRVRVVDADRVELLGSTGNGVDATSGQAVGPAHSRSIVVTGATVPAPNRPVVLTAAGHGLLTGDIVAVHGVQGLNGANGSWAVEVVDATHVRLRHTRGTGAYTGGGAIDAADVVLAMPIASIVDDAAGAIFTVHEHGFATADRTSVAGVGNITGDAANARVAEVLDADRVRLRNVHLAGAFLGGGTLQRPPAVWNTLLFSANGFFDRDNGSNPNPGRGLFRLTMTADGPVKSGDLLSNPGGFTLDYNRVAFAQGGSGATRSLYALVQHGGVPGVTTVNRLRAFLRSTDTGESWTQPGNLLAVTQGWEQRQSHYDLLLAVDPRNPRRVYAGLRLIWVSEDAGDHWRTQMPPSEGGWNVGSIAARSLAPSLTHVHWDQHVFSHLPPTFWPPVAAPLPPVPLFAGNDGGLVRSDDAATTFTQHNEGVATALLLSLDMGRGVGRNGVMFGGMWDNGTAGHRPDSDAARRWSIGSNGDGGAVAVDPADPSVVFGINNGSVVRSFDAGNTWQSQGSGLLMPALEVRNTNPVEVVMESHPVQTGDSVRLVDVQGGNGVANGVHVATRIDDRRFSLNGVNGVTVPAFVTPQRVQGKRYRRSFAVSAATLGSPIEIETEEVNGLATGDKVNIIGVVGPLQANSTAANPWFTITVIDTQRFSLDGSDATGAGPYVQGTGVVRGAQVANELVPIFFAAPFQATAGARPVVVTALGHRFVSGDTVTVSGVRNLTDANVANHPITVIDADSFALDGLTSTQRSRVNARVALPTIGNGLPAGGSADTFVRIAIVANGAARATRIFVSVGRDLYRSDNGGRRFTRVHQNFPGFVTALWAPDPARLWVGLSQFTTSGTTRPGEVWFSRDGGAHWLTDAADSFVGRLGARGSVSSIAEDPRNAQRVAVSFAGYSNSDPRFLTRHVFVSSTAGIRTAGAFPWQEVGGTSFNTSANLPDLPVLAVGFDATATPSDLLVGTDLGVLRQTATGWQRVGSNLPRVSVQALTMDNTLMPAPSIVRIGTYGRSAWELERPATAVLDIVCDTGFAPTLVGGSRTQNMTLHNSGGSALNVTQIRVVGADFAIVPALPAALPLAVGASVTLALRFSPVATGPHAAAVLIDSDDPVRPQQGFDVRGVGAAAGGTAIATIPRRMRFGATLVGRTRDLPFVVENRSRVGIIVTNVDMFTPVPGLTIDAAPARPFALAPGASQSVLLHYAPTVVAAAGFREQLILETTDAGGLQPRTAFVTVVGSAHSVGTDLLTSLLAAIGLAEEPDEVLV